MKTILIGKTALYFFYVLFFYSFSRVVLANPISLGGPFILENPEELETFLIEIKNRSSGQIATVPAPSQSGASFSLDADASENKTPNRESVILRIRSIPNWQGSVDLESGSIIQVGDYRLTAINGFSLNSISRQEGPYGDMGLGSWTSLRGLSEEEFLKNILHDGLQSPRNVISIDYITTGGPLWCCCFRSSNPHVISIESNYPSRISLKIRHQGSIREIEVGGEVYRRQQVFYGSFGLSQELVFSVDARLGIPIGTSLFAASTQSSNQPQEISEQDFDEKLRNQVFPSSNLRVGNEEANVTDALLEENIQHDNEARWAVLEITENSK